MRLSNIREPFRCDGPLATTQTASILPHCIWDSLPVVASHTKLPAACVPQDLQQQLQTEVKRLQGLLAAQTERATEHEAAQQAAEQRMLEQARQLVQLQQAVEAKAQQLKQQALSHTEELQVCPGA